MPPASFNLPARPLSTLLLCKQRIAILVIVNQQGPAELPSDWGKNPDGPEEERLNQRQASIAVCFLLILSQTEKIASENRDLVEVNY